jgi:redox-sensing transcriptional repressor
MMRLRWYQDALDDFKDQGVEVISSRELADKVGMSSAVVRKDLSHCGELGTPGLGYRVLFLRDQIQGVLTQNTCLVVWVGAQWMHDALSIFSMPMELNFRIVAVVDSHPEWIGKCIGQWEVLPLTDIQSLLSGGGVDGAVLAVKDNVRRVADLLIEAGIKGILNLTPVTLTTPPDVNVRHVDLLGEMMALAQECTGE